MSAAQAKSREEQQEPEGEDDDFEVEIVDDTPEEDRGREPAEPVNDDADGDDDDEAAQYSERVQARIKKLKWQYHEERRQREKALREHQAAIEYAKKVASENEKLKKSLDRTNTAAYDAYSSRTEAELAQARSEYKKAYEEGDTDKLIASQEKISRLAARKEALEGRKPKPREEAQEEPVRQQQQQPARQVQQPDPKTMKWLSRNPWFHTEGYEDMTATAYGLHEKAIAREGLSPDSDEYFSYIDRNMQQRYPEYFQGDAKKASSRKPAPKVAGAQRGGPKPRSFTLTASQASIAKRLGLTPKQYAEQLMKDAENG